MPLSRDPSAADNPTAWHSTYFGPHYLALYATRLLKPMETGWEAEFVGTSLRLKVGALILDCPCGFGRHLRRLRRAGYRPIGVDLQVPYLRCAQQLTYEPPVASGVEPPVASGVEPARSFVPVAAADMARLPFPPETFDALANLFTSFGYFPDDPGPGGDWPTNRGVLAEFARVLKRGGRLLIDVPNRDDLVEVIRRNPRTRMAGDDWEIREEWRYDTPTRRMDNKTHFRMQDDESDVGYNMRLYTRSELEDELRAAGLAPFRFWSDLHRDADETSGDRLVIAAEKR